MRNLTVNFQNFLKVREIVTKAIEPLRNSENKVVGSSLEADVLIECGANAAIDEAMLKNMKKTLRIYS